MTQEEKTLGQVTYEAFCKASSFGAGVTFNSLSADKKHAWVLAGKAAQALGGKE